jgi:formyltetrahydrofolate deformylase
MKLFLNATFIGKDRSGVVAKVTSWLFQHGANIEALEEQVTRGSFWMTLQASWKAGDIRHTRARQELTALARSLGMEVTLHAIRPHACQNMALLVTREPHAAETLLKAFAGKKSSKARVAVMIGNRPALKPLAKAHGVPFHLVPFDDRAKGEKKMLDLLTRYEVDFIVLARFMKILSPDFAWRWKNKIINIHPSLLPAFPGASAYRQAYEKGVKVVGVTSHFVTPDLDQGPIICQDAFRLKTDEPLASIVKRGQALESKTLLRAVQLYLRRRLDVHWGRVHGV